MSDPTNAGDASGNGPAATDAGSAEPSEAIKGYQRKLSEKDKQLKELQAKLRQHEGDPTVEDQLAEARAQAEALKRELSLTKAKAVAPEAAGLLEMLAARGIELDDEVIEAARANVAAARPEVSGSRNAPAGQTPVNSDEAKHSRILKETPSIWI